MAAGKTNSTYSKSSSGGGGGEVSVSVVAYASSFPTTAAENTIGVITSSMTSYVMQAKAPTSPTNGLVWICLSDDSSMPVFVDSGKQIQIYPVSAMIYLNGVWTLLTVKVYQNGVWQSFIKILYEVGSVGSISDFSSLANLTTSYTSVQQQDTGIYCSVYNLNGASTVALNAYYTEMIDLSAYRTLSLTVNYVYANWGVNNGGIWLFATSSMHTTPVNNAPYTSVTRITDSASTERVYSLDISALTGKHYVGVFLAVNNTSADIGYYLRFSKMTLM